MIDQTSLCNHESAKWGSTNYPFFWMIELKKLVSCDAHMNNHVKLSEKEKNLEIFLPQHQKSNKVCVYYTLPIWNLDGVYRTVKLNEVVY